MRRVLRLILALAGAAALVLAPGLPPRGGSAASANADGGAALPTGADSFTPELGLPAMGVVAFGGSPASPGEPDGEVWAYGKLEQTPAEVGGHSYADQYTLLERTASGWQVVPLPESGGEPLAPDSGATNPAEYGAFAGEATNDGGVVLLSGQNVVVRDPNGQPTLAEAPPAELLRAGESLLAPHASRAVTLPYAAIEDAGGHTGVLIAPYDDGTGKTGEPLAPGVLHYDGEHWTRESIEMPAGQLEAFTALALACGGTDEAPNASSPQNCWLLASVKAAGGRASLALYRRGEGGSGFTWKRQQVPGLLTEDGTSLVQGAQMLTATSQGVWVDFQPGGGGSDATELVEPGEGAAKVLGPWCHPNACEGRALGSALPGQYRSFAWAGSGEDPGTRVITGLPDRAMLELADGAFTEVVGAGGVTGNAPGGAAFVSAGDGQVEGLIADDSDPDSAPDGEGQSQAIAVTSHPEGDQLQEESVPFRRPLLAVAQAPGTVAGEPGAKAIAVGLEGEIGRYTPGVGWRSESLYNSEGAAQPYTLRGVAWPEANRAYAVGDNGQMWLWRAETGLWEPDPAKPLNFVGNLTAIAFSSTAPEQGYAVGKQGVLLKHGKSWEQVPLPQELREANFTSVTFAGGDALASYRLLKHVPGTTGQYMETGGIAIEEGQTGQHWHVDPEAAKLLETLPPTDTVMSRIAGLADGGVVAAGPSAVLERESSADSSWRFSTQPLPEAQNISALAAYREGSGAIRAIVSIDLDESLGPRDFSGVALEQGAFKVDLPTPTSAGEPSAFLEADPLPNSGYVLKETASGWSDMEHEALPAPRGTLPEDMPMRPDPVLALLVNPSGSEGLAVGGQTGDLEGRGLNPQLHAGNVASQTAAAERFPNAVASSDGDATPATVAAPSGEASFVVAGQATCAEDLCANFAEEQLGPDVWLEHALQEAGKISEASTAGALRAFVYTGGRLPSPCASESECTPEVDRYAELLGGGSLPVLAADSKDLGPFVPGSATPEFVYPLAGAGGTVWAIVLNCSQEEISGPQLAWLREKLREAAVDKDPAIVVGNASLGFSLPEGSGEQPAQIKNHAAVAQALIEGGASAYFFDYPGANVQSAVTYGTRSIPAFGTGTLGYVNPPNGYSEAASLGSSGFLLASVDVAARNEKTNVAPVRARIVPNVGQLALDAVDGAFLRRSRSALFEALARRPLAGDRVGFGNGNEVFGPDPYDQIPFDCEGNNCAFEVPTEYTFTSSNPDVGGFVMHETGSHEALQVQLNAKNEPVPDEPRNAKGELNPDGRFTENAAGEQLNEKGEVVPREDSGLFCAYNAGTTTVTITTGGLSYSEPVTVQAGSVEYPCGTVPLKNPPPAPTPAEKPFSVPEPVAAAPPTVTPQIQAIVPPAPPAHVTVHRTPPSLPLFLPFAPASVVPRAVIVPPPLPPAGEPTPPSGTSQVFQTVGAREEERQAESAMEVSANRSAASVYEANGSSDPLGEWWALALVVIAAGAGTGIRRRRPSRRERPALATASSRQRRFRS